MAGTPIYGQIVKAQFENLAADITGSPVPTGIVYFNTVSSLVKYYDSASWRTLVSTDQAQVITLKDINGGTATNTSRITLPKDTTTNVNALTRKQGTVLYDTTTDQVKYDNGSTLIALGSSAAATADVAGLVTSFVPVVKSSTHAVSSADYTVLDNDGFEHILMSTSNTDRVVTLPTAADNTGRMLTIKKTDSGTGKVTVTGEGAEVIDGTNTRVVHGQYSHVKIVCNGTAWFILDRYSPSIWTSYTPSFGAGLGTVTAIQFFWRKLGSSIEIIGRYQCGTTTGAEASITLPTGYNLNTSALATGSNVYSIIGFYHGGFGSGTNMIADPGTSTTKMFYASGTGALFVGNNHANNSQDVFHVIAPIAEWADN